jgi:hypothetical protein
LHEQKELSPRKSTDAGREIDFNDEQQQIAAASIRVSFDPDSNVNDESDVHPIKVQAPRNSTDAGKQMDSNDEQLESACDSTRVRFDPDSNINEQSESHK